MAGVKGRSGGKNGGAGGRPRIIRTVSDKVKQSWMKSIRKIAREKGKTYQDVAIEMLYDADVQDSVKAAIMKLINEALVSKEVQHSGEVKLPTGPAIMLPESMPDPSLENGGG